MSNLHSFAELYQQKITPQAQAEAMAEGEQFELTPSYPPLAIVPDTISWFNDIDWAEQRQRARSGLNNCGLVIAVLGQKLHDLGVFLAKV